MIQSPDHPMFSTDDTIAAIATPPGRGGIGVVRISGPGAAAVARRLTQRDSFEPRHATLATLRRADGSAIDQAIVIHFPAPHSYTGDDVVEVSAHGSPVVLDAIVGAAIAAGARLANPGEFTFRAYLNGRIDLVQAEAVRDLIDAVTPLQARVAFDQLEGTLTGRLRALDAALLEIIAPLEASLDFPEEGYHFAAPDETARALDESLAVLDGLLADARRGRVIREGLTVAIVGRPNAGKSSLFNRLAGAARAIVTDVPGTTRDLLSERVDVGGVPLTLVDTAGIRETPGDAIEEEGIARARRADDAADVAVVVLDRSRPLTEEDRRLASADTQRPRIVVASKCDLPAAWNEADVGARRVSSLTDEGIAGLRDALLIAAGVEPSRDRAAIANLRHAALLEQAREALMRARLAAADGAPEEFVLADLHDARARFDEVTGARPQDEVLRTIFERFCIGK
ncbi:MAG TPA: tRNA uridine-5-carboxymethylaminomethyl(34) synthesis GTPase MnmE [Vicinamibacterales bacterium]|nr:tRNA uridine-5-carboxymethylaminomethyl(34) synthesis GTPase MnmE [Vicinamibacterales bacterium]